MSRPVMDAPAGNEAIPIDVARAEVMLVRMPLLEPFVTSFGPTSSRHVVLVRLEDRDGLVGWGEAASLDHPFYLSEFVGGSLELIIEWALPLCLRSEVRHPLDAARAMSPIRGNTFGRAGVEAAFWALFAERERSSLRTLFGGRADRIPVGESLGIKPSIDEVVEEAVLRIREGYQRIKLKIKPGWDLDVVREVRRAVGDDVMLQVDANAGYTLEDADHLAGLDAFGLACIEQPLEFDDLLGHAELQRRLDTPVCLDESLRSPNHVRTALEVGACRNVNCKPGRVGGIAASLEIERLCREAGVPLWCGGMLESGIGRAPNIALCSLAGFTEPADMSPAAILYEEDLIDPTYAVDPDGSIEVPGEPGLGYRVDEHRVRSRTIRSVELDGSGTVTRRGDGRKEAAT
jgi:o-succinylbenzoate synthase